ncbi:M24 family metallopeptidase [Thermodesulfobacteriota bacterium]
MFTLTIEERDRRWKIVREAMRKRDLECLIVYGTTGRYRGLAANIRYLSNIAVEGYLVFPLQGDPTLVWFMSRPNVTPWVADNRGGQPKFSKVISERLAELHLENSRVGLVQLSGYDGELGFPHSTYVSLTGRLPKAAFDDATDILLEARMIKSPVEVKCFELGCEVGERVIQAIVDTAKPGVKDYEVRSKIMDTLFREGCEPGSMILYHSGKEVIHGGQGVHKLMSTRTLETGDIILTEFDAIYSGYMVQYNQPFSLGKPDNVWNEIFDVATKAFNNGLNILRPGVSVGELEQAILSTITEAGYTFTNPPFHGLGLTLEEPMGTYPGQPEHKPNTSLKFRPGMILELEPHVVKLDFTRGATVGSPVLVTDTGCQLLSKNWKPEPRII